MINQATLAIILRAIDNVTPELKKVEGGLRGFEEKVGRFSQAVGTAIKKVSFVVGGLSGLVSTTTLLGARFEKAFQNALTMFDATQEEIEALRKTIERLAPAYGVSFEELADTLYTIGSASVSARDAVDALEQTVRAAIAGATNANLTFQSAIGIINAYGMSIEDLNTVYAMQFEAVKKGLLTFEELARDVGQWIPAARNLGVSFREGLAGYIALTTAGIRSSEAATAVEAAFRDLLLKAGDLIENVELQLFDAEGQFVGLTNLIEQLVEKMQGMTDEERSNFIYLMNITATGSRAILTWVNNFEKYKEVLDGIQGSHDALLEAFEKQTRSISFLLNRLKVSLQALGLTVFQALRPELVRLLTMIMDKIAGFTRWIEQNRELVGKLVWGFLKLGAVLLGVLVPLKFFAEMIRAMAHPVVLVLTGIAGAMAGIWKLQNPKAGLIDFLTWIVEIGQKAVDLFKTWGQEIAQLMEARGATSFWSRLVVFFEWLFTKIGQGAEIFLTWLGEKLLALLKWLWEQIKAGSAELWDWFKEMLAILGQWLFESIVVPIVDALQQIFKKSVDWMKDVGEGILGGLKAAGQGIATFGGWLIGKGWLWGKQEGGYTGEGPENEPAGIVHKGEYVVPAWMVRRYPQFVAVLENIRRRGYKQGGYVGGGLLTGGLFDELIRIIESLEAASTPQESPKRWWHDFFDAAQKGFERFANWYKNTFIADLLAQMEQFKNDVSAWIQQLGSTLLQLPGGNILFDIVMTLVSLFRNLESVARLLNPLGVLLEGMMKVLGPVIDRALMPFVHLLTLLGQVLGTLLVPILEPFLGLLQLLAEIFLWLYNVILRPIAQGLYIVFSVIANAFNVLYNVVSDIVKVLTFGLIDLGKRQVKTLEQIIKEAQDKFPEIKPGTFDMGEYGQQYTATVTRTGPETVYNIVNLYANESFIMDHRSKFYDFLAEAVQELIDTGQIKFA